MMDRTIRTGIMLVLIILSGCGNGRQDANAVERGDELRIQEILDSMTLEEKLEQLTGFVRTGPTEGLLRAFDTKDNDRLGIPGFKITDGPMGIRWGKSTVFPSGVSMAATWNRELLWQIGEALSNEALARERNLIFGACVNIHRLPTGGRNFESFGEDPFLSSEMVVPYLQGMQSVPGAVSCVKHFACNNQEWERMTADVIVDERTLREIYLPMFRASVHEAGVHSVMTAYNKVNGQYCSEQAHLINDILKDEWGFDGFVVSDWASLHSTVDAAKNGLDMENEIGIYFSEEKLKAALGSGEVSMETLDDKVRRILRVKFRAGMMDGEIRGDSSHIGSEKHTKLALQTAREGIVLLKNEGLLPLMAGDCKSIAIIGPNAGIARIGGGGSSQVIPFGADSPFEAFTRLAGEECSIRFAEGVRLRSNPSLDIIPAEYFQSPEGKGWKAAYYDNIRLEGEPVAVTRVPEIDFNWRDTAPVEQVKKDSFSIRWTSRFTAPVSGSYTFYLNCDDGAFLYFDDVLVIDNGGQHGEEIKSYAVWLEENQSIEMRIDYTEVWLDAVAQLGWIPPEGSRIPDHPMEEAVKTARDADAVVLCVGYADFLEGEEIDRSSMDLPYKQDELIRRVHEANPNSVVVIYGGGPVHMQTWQQEVPAILHAFYPGQEGSSALAEIVLGRINPSGKLPVSYLADESQTPVYGGYQDPSLKINFHEGIFVGYRYLDKNSIEPAYPFGHGLSYTTFLYKELSLTRKEDLVEASLTISNTGSRDGYETIQLYVRDTKSSLPRPEKELKAFEKVFLEEGESKTVKLVLEEEDFAFYHPGKGRWIAEPGNFEILAGASSGDIRLRKSISW